MFEITVKWPDGRTATVGGFTDESVGPMVEFLWQVGADDVIRRCACGDCDTCRDRSDFLSAG